MKLLTAIKAIEPLTAGLNLADSVVKLTLGLLPTSEERIILIRWREVAIKARSAKNATKAQKQALKIRLRAILKGIRVAVKHGRPLDELHKDLDVVLGLLGD